jgi:2-amino-4-hydroxy-6-hydroxymethyldihydropteridine diphosphokinase
MSIVYIGIGSNLGNRQENCLKAIELLKGSGLRVNKQSSMYETEPWGIEGQPEFINMAVEAETELRPLDLLSLLKKIEAEMGREKTVKWGPRLIDLDILLYANEIINGDSLEIPHPLMHERAFVLEPLSEIAPDALHPVLSKKISELLQNIKKIIGKSDRVLIFGVGNPLYRDDGLGNKIIEVLSEKYHFPDSTGLIESGSMTDLIDFLDDYKYIIVIDTISTGKKPGEILSFGLDEMVLPLNSLSHSTGFLAALKTLKERPDIFFICIEPEDLSLGTGLSDKVSDKIPETIKMVLDKLTSHGLQYYSL